MSDKQPTPGLRLAIDDGEYYTLNAEGDTIKMMMTRVTDEQREINVEYVNGLIEADERRREHAARQAAGAQDLLVDLGNLQQASLDQIALDVDYESMVEDFLQTFNNIVIQGVKPIKAIFSFSQAFAIALGCCLKANLPWPVAQALLTQIMKSASASEKMIKVITKN